MHTQLYADVDDKGNTLCFHTFFTSTFLFFHGGCSSASLGGCHQHHWEVTRQHHGGVARQHHWEVARQHHGGVARQHHWEVARQHHGGVARQHHGGLLVSIAMFSLVVNL